MSSLLFTHHDHRTLTILLLLLLLLLQQTHAQDTVSVSLSASPTATPTPTVPTPVPLICPLQTHLVGSSCIPDCSCTGGSPQIGATNCTTGAEGCASCNDQFHFNQQQTQCIADCTCLNGFSNVGATNCTTGAEGCASCIQGFHVVGTLCIPNCSCSNGQAQEGTNCQTGSEGCNTCNEFLHRNGAFCVPNVCECNNGTPMLSIFCLTHGSQHCTSCNTGFTLDSNTPPTCIVPVESTVVNITSIIPISGVLGYNNLQIIGRNFGLFANTTVEVSHSSDSGFTNYYCLNTTWQSSTLVTCTTKGDLPIAAIGTHRFRIGINGVLSTFGGFFTFLIPATPTPPPTPQGTVVVPDPSGNETTPIAPTPVQAPPTPVFVTECLVGIGHTNNPIHPTAQVCTSPNDKYCTIYSYIQTTAATGYRQRWTHWACSPQDCVTSVASFVNFVDTSEPTTVNSTIVVQEQQALGLVSTGAEGEKIVQVEQAKYCCSSNLCNEASLLDVGAAFHNNMADSSIFIVLFFVLCTHSMILLL